MKAIMLGGADAAELLANLIRISKAKKGIEIGVFTGYSTMTMARALPEDGLIYGLDIEDTDLGRKYWKKEGVSDKIKMVVGDAIKSMDDLLADESNHGTFDFAFIDADKANYVNYYEKMFILLKKGGWIAFDNAFAGGGVYGGAFGFSKEQIKAIDSLNEKLCKDERVHNVLLNLCDGVHLVVKK